MQSVWSRRAFLACLPAAAHAQPPLLREVRKFRDAATEFEIVRLTDPARSNCFLPPTHLRPISDKGNSLLYCSDRSGTRELYRMDLKTGESRAVPHTEGADPAATSFLPDERSICCFAGDSLITVSGSHVREICRIESGWTRGQGFGLAGDGNHAVFVEEKDGSSRLRLATIRRPAVETVLQRDSRISDPMPRPRRVGILYRDGGGLWLVNYDGQQNRRLKLASGRIGPTLWSSDGRTIVYIQIPEDRTKLHQLRECTPDTNEDKALAATSQFIGFTRNGDGSVFAGVSASKPSPHILLLLRMTRREMTVCEHRATDPSRVVVLFSPNSQRVLYQTDWQGKAAIYSVSVDRFVERTDT
jgi:oligogalacturonide lyase